MTEYVGNGRGFRTTRRQWVADNWVKVAVYTSLDMAKKRAVKRGVPHTLPPRYATFLANQSGGVCALSGIQFCKSGVHGKPGARSPSVDRIRPELGYVPGNLRLILNGLNSLKMDCTDDDVLAICRAVVAQLAPGCGHEDIPREHTPDIKHSSVSSLDAEL